MSDKLKALLDGMRNAATLGWGDELTPEIMGMLPAPDKEERIYAAGSPESDMRQTMRDASEEHERRFPRTFHSGEALGAFPGLAALPAAAGGVAGAGLIGGLLGAVKGAGGANGAPMLESAARGAGPEALMGMGAAAIPGVGSELKNMLGEMPRELEPAIAGAQINQHNAINPPKGYGGGFQVPKASKPLVEEAMIPASEDVADLSYAANTKKAMGKTVPDAEIKALNKAKDKLAAGPQPEQPKTVRPPRRKAEAADPISQLREQIAQGVDPNEIGRLKTGMARGTYGPVDMAAMRAPYKGQDPTHVATTHFDPIEVSVEHTPTGPSYWLKDGRHRLQNAIDEGATAIKANVRTPKGEEEELLFSGPLPFKNIPKP